jgi:phosphatidylinositol glycan class Z
LLIDTAQGRVMLTPLNSLLYNMDQSNLAKHGLHPRFLHALVNLPLLFGPLYLCLLVSLMRLLRRQTARSAERLLLAGCVLLPLLLLSAAPHQEPRFLVPLAVPLCLFCTDVLLDIPGSKVSDARSSILSHSQQWIWLSFNLLLFFVYGVLHQGGVIPSLLLQPAASASPYHLVYFRTYL